MAYANQSGSRGLASPVRNNTNSALKYLKQNPYAAPKSAPLNVNTMPVSKTAGYSQARPVSIPSVHKTAGYSITPRHNGSGNMAVQNTDAIVNPSTGGGGGGSAGGGYGAGAQAQEAQAKRDAMLKSMEDYLKNSSDSMYKQQEAGFAKTRDEQLAGIGRAFDEAVKAGNMSIEEANLAFDGAVKQLDANLYRDSQLTNIAAFDRGLQNSQQMIALQQGDVNRKNVQQNEYSMERTRRVNSLKDRISSLTKQKDLDLAQTNTDYNYNITGARAQADMQLNDGMFKLKQAEYDQMQAMAQALASRSFNGGGGGGGGQTKSQPVYDLGGTDELAQGFNQFLASKQETALDNYYSRAQSLTKKSVMDKRNPLGVPRSIADNANLTAWDKMKMFGG